MVTIKRTLIAVVILIILVLSYIIIKEESHERLFSQVKSKVYPSYTYLNNPHYQARNEFFAADSFQKNIVMLGNSHTGRINWNDLLNREDIANRGIGSDITEGFMNRLNSVINLHPKICFIEGGVNDIAKEIPSEVTINNLNRIIDTLVYHKITPVLMVVTLVANNYPRSRIFNKKVKELNIGINQIAADKHIAIIDLNPILSDGENLKRKYAESGGIHFTKTAYLVWRDEVLKILNHEKI